MRKISIVTLFLSLILLLSCENIVAPSSKDFKFPLGEDNAKELEETLSRNINISNDTKLVLECNISTPFNTTKQKKEVLLKDLANVTFDFNNVKFGDYNVVLDVYYDNILIYTANALPFTLNEYTTHVDVTLNLQAKSYPINFELNGGEFSNNSFIVNSYNFTSNYSLPRPVKGTSTFVGWFTEENGKGTQVTKVGKEYFNGELTLYAFFIDETKNVSPVSFITPNNTSSLDYNDEISLSCKTSDAKIYYTTDGSDPVTSGTKTLYKSPIPFVDENLIIKAYGEKPGLGNSIVSSSNKYTMKKYKVTFINNNKGEAIPSVTLPYLSKIDNKTLSEKGYTLLGWYKDELCSTNAKWNFDSDTVPKHDITLYASWKENSYTLSFDANGGEGKIKPVTLTYTQQYKIPLCTFTKPGFKFGGYYLSKEGSGNKYSENDSVTSLSDIDNSTVTLYASWIPDTYKVVFDPNVPSNTSSTVVGGMSEENYTYNENKPLLQNSYTLKGYKFIGWKHTKDGIKEDYADGQSVSNLPNIVDGTVTLYAHWKPITYIVSFNSNDNNASGEMTEQTFTYDEEKTLNGCRFTKTGYVFDKWTLKSTYVNGDTSFSDYGKIKNLTTIDNGKVNLYAQYNPITYSIEYNENIPQGTSSILEGTMPQSQKEIKYDQLITLNKNTATLKGYDFKGWKTTIEGQVAEFKNGQNVEGLSQNGGTVKLYAHWEPITYTVNFQYIGKTSQQTLTYDKKEPLLKNTFTNSGFTFGGWQNGSITYTDEEEVVNLSDTAFSTVVLKPTWVPNTYRIVFDSNVPTNTASVIEGTMAPIEKIKYGDSVKFKPNAYTLKGYNFRGWKKAKDGAKVDYVDEQSASSLTTENDVTVKLYAHWEPITYTVSYSGNQNDSGTSMSNQEFTYDKPVLLAKNTYTRKGYDFKDWLLVGSNPQVFYSDEQEVSNLTSTSGAIVTLRAQWASNAYNVHFDANVPSNTQSTIPSYVTMDDQSFSRNESKALSSNRFTLTGYTFKGWKTTKDGQTAEFTDGQTVTDLTSNAGYTVTLYAHWEPITYKVQFKDESGTIKEQTLTYDKEEPLQKNTFTKSGFTFNLWRDELLNTYTDQQNVLNLKNKQDEVIILNPLWNGITYSVKYDSNVPTNTSSVLNGVMEEQTGFKYDKLTNLKLNAYELEGYTFKGWKTTKEGQTAQYSDSQGVEGLTTENGGVVTLYAHWQPITYNVSFKDVHQATGTMNDITAVYDSKIKLPPVAFTRKGYTFDKWSFGSGSEKLYFSDEGEILNLNNRNNGSVNLYSEWLPNTYTVHFDPNGGTGTMSDVPATYDKLFVLPQCTFESAKTGYTFAGWEKDNGDGTTTAYEKNSSVKNIAESGEVTLKAIWLPSVTFSPDSSNAKLDLGDQITLTCPEDPTLEIYYSSDNSAYQKYTGSISFTEPNGQMVGAYVKDKNGLRGESKNVFYEQKTYRLTFNNGGHGTAPSVSQSFVKGDTFDLGTLDPLTCSGYTFSHWEDSNKQKVEGVITINSNTELTAKWTLDSVTTPTVKVVPTGVEVSWVNPATELSKVVITDAADSTLIQELTLSSIPLYASQTSTYKFTSTDIPTTRADCKFRIKAVSPTGEESALVSFPDLTLPTTSMASINPTNAKGPANATDTVPFTMSVTGTFGEGFSADSFAVEASNLEGVTPTVSFANSTVTINLQTPKKTGTYGVALRYAGRFIQGSFIVKDYSIGDIVYSDGSISTKNIEGLTPVSVIFREANTQATPALPALGVGLKESETQLSWTLDTSPAYEFKIAEIVCQSKDGTDLPADTATFDATSDTDGSDNWSYILQRFSDEATALEQCPVFKWVKEYSNSTLSGLKNTPYVQNWYLPSIKELCDICKLKDKINTAFSLVGGKAFTENEWHWSSSQRADVIRDAWMLNFTTKRIGANYKSDTNYVRCIRAF